MENLISSARQRLSLNNTTIDFVQVTPGQPLTNLPSSGRGGTPRTTSATTSTATSSASTASTSTVTQATTQDTATVGIQTTDSTTQVTQTTDTTATTTDTIDSTGTTDVFDTGISDTIVSDTTGTAESTGITDTKGTQQTPVPERLTDAVNIGAFSLSMPAILGIILLLLLLLALIIFFATRKLGSSPNRVMASVAATREEQSKPTNDPRFADHSKDLAEYAAIQSRQRTTPYTDREKKTEKNKPIVINPSGPLLLNLYVEDQSIAIGKRNIHSLKSGYSLTVGGGKSDFLIFLVPIPANIGELRRSGTQLTFIPRRPKYFPDLGSSELRDCLNKSIRIISDKGYELRLRFEMYEDPLVALNRMLMSIKVPG
jgi:Sec-independent protein translocase protein TatA